ncbi:unnamed protein product [Rhizophagus irregularis]|uniref:Uncharacterized protein n=1 Tax=Rhizophagus irregularis TaxID=588596 RepID=A0A916EBP0_9GLOM|nr:unnamed protein product [Rhizophagus irregularis]CAB5216445.1 unnamed protein product [Rhizophagus irregularis]CAB5375076.1 unnamed protein product [Rhizophagus irregularis]
MQLKAYSIKYLYSPSLNQCLVFEDAINGIHAALNAKMNVIWVSNPSIRELHSNVSGIVEVIPSLENFDLAKYGLPPY